MKIEITINTDNAAFQEDSGELGRILRTVSEKVAGLEPGEGATLRDANGNTVGSVRMHDEEGA